MYVFLYIAALAQVYVSNEDSGDVSVIDAETHRVRATIAVGKRPRGLRLARDGRTLYVALSGSPKADADTFERAPPDRAADGIAVVDVRRGRVLRVLPGGEDPESFDLSPDGRHLYVSNESAAALSVVEVDTGRIIGRIEVGGEPAGVATRPDGAIVYVTSEADGHVYAIDAAALRVLGKVPVGARPRSVVFTPDGKRAFVSAENGARVTVVDAERHAVVDEIAIDGAGARPMGIALSSTMLFVSTGRGRGLAFVDLATHLQRLVAAVGARPWGVGVTKDGHRVFTANGPSNDVSVLDAESGRVLDRVRVGRSPWGVAVGR